MNPVRRATLAERLVDGWWIRHRRTSDPVLRLFCFPFAGGGAAAFADWAHALPPAVDVLALEPPGRGTRVLETPLRKLGDLVAAAERAVVPMLDRPFAFFGHSMGAIVSFELARALRRRGGPQPLRLLLSAASAPRFGRNGGRPRGKILHDLPDRELISEIQRLNGTPKEVCESEELMEITLPMLRADLEAIETHACAAEEPLDCPVSVYGGREDPEVTPDELADWQRHTRGALSVKIFPGDHFYIASSRTDLLAHVARDLHGHLGLRESTAP